MENDWKNTAKDITPKNKKSDSDWMNRAQVVAAPYDEIEYDIEGELPHGTRAQLSFASGEGERRAFLEKKYPGIKFAKDTESGENIVLLPGETKWKYEDDPSLTMKDVSDFAGDVPGLIGTAALTPFMGPFAAGALGEAGGEVARKAIGRKVIGIPTKQKTGQDVMDVGLIGLAGGVGGKIGVLVEKQLAKRFGKKAAQEMVKNMSEEELEQTAKQVSKSGELGIQGEDIAPDMTPDVTPSPEKELVQGEIDDQYARDQFKEALPPKSIAEIGEKVEAGRQKFGQNITLQKLKEAQSVIPDLEFKPHAGHEYALQNKNKWDLIHTAKEMPGEVAEKLKEYEYFMKQEGQQKLKQEITSMAPGDRREPLRSGADLISETAKDYKDTKKKLGPIFERMREIEFDKEAKSDFLYFLMDKHPNSIYKLIRQNKKTGKLGVQKFNSKYGLSQKEYRYIKQLVEDFNDPSFTLSDLMNIRTSMLKEVDPKNPRETLELQKLRSNMLDYMEEKVGNQVPEMRAVMREYAINEEKKEVLEKILGGKIDTDKDILAAKSSKVLDRLFRDPETTKMVADIYGPEKVNQMAADYIDDLYETLEKDGNLSVVQFIKKINNKRDSLFMYAKPETQKRIQAIATILRLTADAPPVNPSGTAKTLTRIQALRKGGVRGLLDREIDAYETRTIGQLKKQEIDDILSGLAEPPVPYRPGSKEGVSEKMKQKKGLTQFPYGGLIGAGGGAGVMRGLLSE